MGNTEYFEMLMWFELYRGAELLMGVNGPPLTLMHYISS